jgi:hypothetical protein
MRSLIPTSFPRLAFAAVLAASVALPVVASSSHAFARTGGGAAGGASGGGAAGGGGSSGNGGGSGARGVPVCITACDGGPRVTFGHFVAQRRDAASCLRREPIFDRWGYRVGERALNVCEP